jgi:ferrous iron transport protein B
MMTFPGLSEEQIIQLEKERIRVENLFLASEGIAQWIPDSEALAELDGLVESYSQIERGNEQELLKNMRKHPQFPILQAIFSITRELSLDSMVSDDHLKVASRYLEFTDRMVSLAHQKHQAALKRTIAGWLGQKLESITRPLGFDYRTNMALVGGFAAKEVVVSTLGTAYSLGDVDPDEAGTLAERLQQDPNWNPLSAFTLLVFTMLYVPCFVTVISIRRETSWIWAGFSIGFNLVVAYVVSLLIRTIGMFLGLGA